MGAGAVTIIAMPGMEMKRDYEINENNGRSAGSQPACSKKVSSLEHAGWEPADRPLFSFIS